MLVEKFGNRFNFQFLVYPPVVPLFIIFSRNATDRNGRNEEDVGQVVSRRGAVYAGIIIGV